MIIIACKKCRNVDLQPTKSKIQFYCQHCDKVLELSETTIVTVKPRENSDGNFYKLISQSIQNSVNKML